MCPAFRVNVYIHIPIIENEYTANVVSLFEKKYKNSSIKFVRFISMNFMRKQ